MEIAVKAVESSDELRMAIELMAKTHTEGDDLAMRWLESCATQYPGFRREHTRIAIRKHEVLGALRLTTDTIRIGEARLKMGGLGWVATAAHYQRRGVCRQLVEDTVRYMREHGYHVSMLFGIVDFYHRFGYVTTLADYSVWLDTMEALSFENPFREHTAKPGDVAAIQKIHNANDSSAACSMIRSAGHIRNKWGRWSEWRVLKDERGKLAAYYLARPDGDSLQVCEVGLDHPSYCAAVVSAAGHYAEHEGLARVRFHVPPSGSFGRFLTRFRSVHEMRVDRDGGGMMAFVDAGETLESMIPEWESLIGRSAVRDLRTEFTLLVNGSTYRIRSNHGAVDINSSPGASKIGLTPGDLMHLVTGYRYAEDTLDERRCLISPEARALFTTIFPKRDPYVWMFDRF
jgi:predicted acetyltransferase